MDLWLVSLDGMDIKCRDLLSQGSSQYLQASCQLDSICICISAACQRHPLCLFLVPQLWTNLSARGDRWNVFASIEKKNSVMKLSANDGKVEAML